MSPPKTPLRLSSLKGERAFRQVAAGEAVRTPLFTLRRLPYKPRYGEKWQPHAVVGIVVSKKTLPRAVDRNRARRRVREALRALELAPCRAMLILNAEVLQVNFADLKAMLERAFARPLSAVKGKGGKGDKRPRPGVAQ